jgi:hypothetical protein
MLRRALAWAVSGFDTDRCCRGIDGVGGVTFVQVEATGVGG